MSIDTLENEVTRITRQLEYCKLQLKYSLTSIMSPLFTEHLDIITQKFETELSSVKLPRYYPYHP